jgi:uncharacterized protein (DUF885 family)
MRAMRRTPLLIIALAAPALAAPDADFDKLVDEFYAGYSAAHPTEATSLGLHDHDADLDDLSPAGIKREVARLESFRPRFQAIDEKKLSPERAIDLQLVRDSIAADLLNLQQIQQVRHEPAAWSRLANRAVYVIISRDYAPADVRLKAAVARMERVPALLDTARGSLTDVAPIAIDIALREIPGMVSFFQKDVPRAFPSVKDAKLASALRKSCEATAAALLSYEKFLRELRPRAKGGYALGEPLFRQKLKLEEMIETPPSDLLASAESELKRLQSEFRVTAAKIDPKRPAAAVQADLAKDHPKPEAAIADTAARLQRLRKFLADKKIVTVPSEILPKVQETPPFLRATTMASMDTPGPFETRATEAYYSVTLPEPGLSAAQVDEFMENFARTLVDVVSIHEAYPGHYVQFLWQPRLTSKVRKFTDASSNSEGWAHYCEQMILDEGFGDGDPKLRLAQLQDALLRAARYVAAIRMHTRGATYDDIVTLFEKEGYQTRPVAEIEARRATEDPTFLVYTYGKLEILKLRDEYKRKLGPAWSLGKFHDAFLGQGPIPLPLMRRALLGK